MTTLVATFPARGLSGAFGQSDRTVALEAASTFAARLVDGGFTAHDIEVDGLTVTWQTTSDSAMYAHDLAETVGYYGSSQTGKATLSVDGGPARTCPVSY